MKQIRLLVFLAFFQVFFISQSFPQTSPNQKRPKIGLVLSGGGAKGLAHIGILRSLEQAGLPPDYITGTSMGSIVGALYALGYSANDIEAIVATLNWDILLSNRIPLNEITFEEKQYYGRYIAELPVEGLKVGLPRGLIDGQKLSDLLSRLTRAAHDIEDFNDLPIPFACMAADIATGEPVLLSKGSLPQAIRASMAIPTVFTPVEIDGRLLVDGGLVRNFPVEEVLAMGADIVIGVFVSSDLSPKEELNNMISLLTQSAFVTSAFDTRKQREMVDIYIEPGLKRFSTGSFKASEQIIAVGDSAGAAFYEVFKNLADSLDQIGPPRTIQPLPVKNEYLISDVRIEGNKQISSAIIKGKLRIEEGSILSIDEIEKHIALLYGTRYFDKVEYEITKNGPQNEIIIKVRESSPGQLKLAAYYDSENNVGLTANLTYRNLLMPYSRSLIEFNFSKNPMLDINFLKYFGKNKTAGLMPGYMYRENELPFFDGEMEISRVNARFSDLYLTIQSTSFQNLTFGGKVMAEYSNITPKIGEAGLAIERIQNRNFSAEVFLQYNSFDRQFYPRRGSSVNIRAKQAFDVKNTLTTVDDDSLGTSTSTERQLDPFFALEMDYTQIIRVHPRFLFILKNAMVLTTLGDISYNLTDYYFIGGFNPSNKHVTAFWGVQDKRFFAPNYYLGKLTAQWEFSDNLFFSGIFNYIDVQYPMAVFYDITVNDYLDGEKRRLGYGLSLGYNSFLGPMAFSWARDSKSSNNQYNLNIGYWIR